MNVQPQMIPHNVPIRDAKLLPAQPPAQIIGRNRELAAAQKLLKAGMTVFLSGPAGAGKTALAAMLASAMIASKRSILWLHILEDDLEMLVARVGRALGLDAYTGDNLSAHVSAVKQALQREQPLLILDGLLDIDSAREFAKNCTAGIPTILIAENSAAGPWTPVELPPVSNDDARAIFQFYSGLNDPLYAADIEAVCKFLDGLPLSLQLAARLVAADNLTPAELLTMLPSSTGRDATLVILPILFKRLSAQLQGILLVLASTFSGTAGLELLTDLSGMPGTTLLPILRQLVGRGFAREAMAFGQPTFTIHEAVQRYAISWLRNYQRLSAVETRALQSTLVYAERHADTFDANQDRLAAEMPNLLGAAAFATDRGNAASLARLVEALGSKAGDFVRKRGFQPEFDQMKKLQLLLKTPPTSIPEPGPTKPTSRPNPIISEATIPTQATPVVPPLPPLNLPAAHQPTTPVPVIRPITPVAPTALDSKPPKPAEPPVAPDATRPTTVALVQVVTPKPEHTPEAPTAEDTETPTSQSIASMEAQLRDAQTANDGARAAAILQSIGASYAHRGNYANAVTPYKEALAIYEKLNNLDGMVATYEALTELARLTETQRDDLEYAIRGVELAKKLGDKARLGHLQMALGDAQARAGNHANAIQTYMEAVQTLRSVEDWANTGIALSNLGASYLALGQYQEAAMMSEQAMVIFHREGQIAQESRAIEYAALAYTALRQWPQAIEMYDRALYLARERFDHPSEALYLGAIGNIHKVRGLYEDAILNYRQALDSAFHVGNESLQAEYLLHLGGMLLYNPKTLNQAAQCLREAHDYRPDDSDVRRLLHRVEKQLGRINAAGIPLPPADESTRHYAANASIR